QLTVFNLHGERVINLIDEFQPAGWHHVELDGSELTSGVYFYRLRLNQQNSIVKKMVLLR
ncbi:MAG: T9SS type A sorting domain-containing protein, partial [Calditrichaeota bacterium]|nr:T9SS type A sorting domain-containing protein [Calditrichota bacterium]